MPPKNDSIPKKSTLNLMKTNHMPLVKLEILPSKLKRAVRSNDSLIDTTIKQTHCRIFYKNFSHHYNQITLFFFFEKYNQITYNKQKFNYLQKNKNKNKSLLRHYKKILCNSYFLMLTLEKKQHDKNKHNRAKKKNYKTKMASWNQKKKARVVHPLRHKLFLHLKIKH